MTYTFSENQWGEKFIEEINREDFTSTKSIDFFSSALDFKLSTENTIYIVVGSDSGLILPYLAKQSLGRGSKIVVVEHDDLYSLIAGEYRGLLEAHQKDGSVHDGRISLHRFSTWRSEVFDGSDEAWIRAGKIKIVESNASSADYSRIYTSMYRSIDIASRERIEDISTTLNRAIFTKLQFQNSVDNTTPLKRSDSFGSGKTAIVLGGGPSLDLHIDWVKQNREKLFILSVSRIANKLMKLDIEPDILCSVDSLDFSYEVCKQGLLWSDVPLVYNYHVSPKLLQQWQGPRYYLGRRFPWHADKELEPYIPAAGPTVGHTAMFVAAHLGFSTILLTGIDGCFSSSAASHAADSPEQMIQNMPSLCDTQVETYSGRIAGTRMSLKNGLVELEKLGALFNRNGPVVFNLSLEAGRCPSIPWIDFNDVKLSTERPRLSQLMDMDIQPASESDLDDLERELKLARHRFSKIKQLCAEARNCVTKIHAPDANQTAQKHSHKLKKIRKEIELEYSDLVAAIIFDNGHEFDKTDTPTDFDQMSAKELTEWGCHYYDLLEKGAETMTAHIDSVQPRIDLRRTEQSEEVDARALMSLWRDDSTPGRILLWKRLNWSRVEAKDRAWVQRTVGKFRSTLNEPAKLVKEKLTNWNDDINNVLKSLVFLSQEKRLEELESISDGLPEKPWPYNALKPFVTGLISELRDDTTGALQNFQSVIDLCSDRLNEKPDSLVSMQRLIEESLSRMTDGYITLENYQSALTTLGMLCEILPSYVVSYAKMLNVCGQNEFAIELLESYVELYPANTKARFTLNKFKSQQAENSSDGITPEYIDKISGAVHAIMGDTSERAV